MSGFLDMVYEEIGYRKPERNNFLDLVYAEMGLRVEEEPTEENTEKEQNNY